MPDRRLDAAANGLAVVRQVRASGSPAPILMLTGRDELADKLAGFKAGADDYREALVITDKLNEYARKIDRYVERERDFLRMAGHELRTPIAVIASTTEVALDVHRILRLRVPDCRGSSAREFPRT